jgi:hypothetical protein
LSGSAPVACGGAVIGDLFAERERASAMAVYTLGCVHIISTFFFMHIDYWQSAHRTRFVYSRFALHPTLSIVIVVGPIAGGKECIICIQTYLLYIRLHRADDWGSIRIFCTCR